MRHIVLPTLLAPLMPGLLLLLFFSFTGEPRLGVWAFGVAVLIGYPACVFLGLPIHLALVKFGATAVQYYVALGFLLGVVLCSFLIIPIELTFEWPLPQNVLQSLKLHAFAGLLGVVAASSFWFFTRAITK